MSESLASAGDPEIELDDVLDIAANIVINDGFDALSFSRVCSRLEVEQSVVIGVVGSVEQMLIALLNREYTRMFHELLDNIERDPLGGRLSRIYRYVLSAVYERPLARALYLTDRDGLHRILRATNGFAYVPQLSVRSDFIDLMKEAGVVRADVNSTSVSAVISAVSAGTALTAPDGQLDDIASGLAMLLERSVDTNQTDTSEGKAVFLRYAMSLGTKRNDNRSERRLDGVD